MSNAANRLNEMKAENGIWQTGVFERINPWIYARDAKLVQRPQIRPCDIHTPR